MSTHRSVRSSFVTGALALALAGTQPWVTPTARVHAQSDEIVLSRKLPMVNGHRFLTSSVVPEPFITTNIRSSLGFGLLFNARIPFLDSDGDPITVLEGDIGIGLLGLQFQQAFTPWLAARVGFAGGFRTGTNGESLVAEGLNGAYSVNGGLTAQLLQTSSVVVSAVGDISSNEVFVMDPFGFAETIIERCQDAPSLEDCDLELEDSERLVQSGSATTFSAGLRGAYSPAAWVGLLARAEIGSVRRLNRDREPVGEFGVAASMDADPVWNIPLGLLLSFNSQTFDGRGTNAAVAATRYGAGLFYTGRSEFLVGFEAAFGKVDLAASEGSVNSATFIFRLEYIF